MNPYLARLLAQHEAARTAITTIQTTAAQDGEHGRSLTDAETAAVTEHARSITSLVPQIEALAAQETEANRISALAATLNAAPAVAAATDQVRSAGAPAGTGEPLGTEHTRSGDQGAPRTTGNAQTQDRDPGHYRSAREGGEHSFFHDLVHAREGDREAATRLEEHNRALSTGVAGAGIVPPNWLVNEYEALARQGRVVSAGVRQITITNPAPMTLPRQTGDTSAVIAEQATENTHPAETDGFATAVDTVIPKPTSGIQVVSRQMIDMTNPAVDALIYGDMLSVYNRKVEDKVTAALLAAAGTANTTFATEAAFSTGQAASDAIIDAAFAVWDARKLPADSVAMRIRRWGKFNKMRDTAGRKLYPTSDAGPMNVDGVGSVQSAGNIDGLVVHPSEGLGTTAYPESILVYRASDTILFEGAMQRFRFEEVAGPESVKLGIWAYTAVIVRQAANSVRRVVITAAS